MVLVDWLLKKLQKKKEKTELGTHEQESTLGIRDVAINALWSPEDEKDVDEELEYIRSKIDVGESIPLSFQDKLERKFNDQTVHFEKSGKEFDPLKVSPKKYDLVTLSGMGAITELLTGRRTKAFTHYRSGTGTAIESASDTKLQFEHFTVSMITDGFAEPAGSSAKFLGKFPISAPTATVSEAAVFDGVVGGTMLFRTVFNTDQQITHVQFQTFFSLSQTVSMISIT